MILLALSLGACGNTTEEHSDDNENLEELANYDGEELGGETFDEFDERRDSYDGQVGSFAGDGCTDDCSGHEAGYNWAEEKGIDDPDDCGGNSWSFIEGCQSYAEENSY